MDVQIDYSEPIQSYLTSAKAEAKCIAYWDASPDPMKTWMMANWKNSANMTDWDMVAE